MANFVFGNAQSLREISAGTYKTEAALQAAVIASMATAAALYNSFSCTVSVSSYSAQDVQNVMRILNEKNFGASLSGSTLTITW